MKILFLITFFVLVGCTNGYQAETLPTIKPTRIPTKTFVPSHPSYQATREESGLASTPDQAELTDSEKEEYLLSLIGFIIQDQPKGTESLQKYLPNIDLEIKRNVITYSTREIIDDPDEYASLVVDLIFAASIASTEHASGDWGINRIEFIMNPKFNVFYTTFVDGHDKIARIKNEADASALWDLLESESSIQPSG